MGMSKKGRARGGAPSHCRARALAFRGISLEGRDVAALPFLPMAEPLLRRRELLTAASAAGIALVARRAGAQAPAAGAPPLAGCKTKFAANVEMWWGGVPFLDKIRKAKELGFPAVEFWPYQGKPIDELSALSRDLQVEVAQFTAWGFVPGMNETKNHDAFESAIRESFAVAKKLRCRKMTVVAGNDVAGLSREEMHKNVITALKRVKPIAEGEGVMLILEPMNIRVDHKGHCLYGSTDAVRICREVGSPMVKINWDLYHMQISEGDLCGHLREGFDQLGYAQLADHPGRHEPGTGEICYSRVLRQLAELGYRDFVGVECTPSEAEPKAAARLAAADSW